MVIDCCTYNDECDLWDIHYNVLKDAVDEFIVIEFDKTFSGKPRETGFVGIDKDKYPKANFITHTEELYGKYTELAESSPNTKGAEHWKREFMQKESIKDALEYLRTRADDIVFVGDVDEIWDPECLSILKDVFSVVPSHAKIKLNVYSYWLNNRSDEEFWGTLVSPYLLIKPNCLNHMRSDGNAKSEGEYGWHFTSMGGVDNVHKKLTDSYTQESYAAPQILDNLAYNIWNGKDFLGRDFTYKTDESEWPTYLKENREKYAHLCKPEVGGGTPITS